MTRDPTFPPPRPERDHDSERSARLEEGDRLALLAKATDAIAKTLIYDGEIITDADLTAVSRAFNICRLDARDAIRQAAIEQRRRLH